jgi:prepilin-type N-terminal cleavage/methylation domain-containing protein
MSRNKMSGFTLIELMVVIVIIGVLASLAIPRFSDASDKAKVAEAPRILASFESAFLTAVAEMPWDSIKGKDNIIFDTSGLSSKWFKYGFIASNKITGLDAKAAGKIGKYIKANDGIKTEYNDSTFDHSVVGSVSKVQMARYVPNFFK